MTVAHANAQPTKRFFIEMLTADIALEDAILDLIDNSVDAITSLNRYALDASLLSRWTKKPAGEIDISITSTELVISDNGIGMTKTAAMNEIFRLGRLEDVARPTLGVYGIGMKRALFKIGGAFNVLSLPAVGNGFRATLPDVEEWKASETSPTDWTIPLFDISAAERRTIAGSGTIISISKIRDDVKRQMRDSSLISRLRENIGTTYGLLIGRYLTIKVNGAVVDPIAIPLGTSAELPRTLQRFALVDGNVQATVLAGLAAKGHQLQENAGWYVLCNGRVVVASDTTSASGWGVDGNPQFIPNFRAFIGVVLFFSKRPALLPWKTTKRGLNPDAAAFLELRPKMWAIAKPVLGFLRSYYYSADTSATETRKLQDDLKAVDFSKLKLLPDSTFASPRSKRKKSSDIVNVQYPATKREIDAAAELLGEPDASASKVGRAALDYLLEDS